MGLANHSPASSRSSRPALMAAPVPSPSTLAVSARSLVRSQPAASSEPISLVNMAARQRMLSQRMLLQTVLAARGDQEQLQAALKSLQLFSESQARLVATADELDEASAQRIRATYTGVSGVGPRIEEFMRCMHRALQAIGGGDLHPQGLDELVADNDAVLAALNTATTTFDTIGKGKAVQLMKDLTAIVSDIQTVAREAKIVSFNAQVIAARAGQHGREFAVVASVLSGISTEVDGLARKAIDLAARTTQPA
jgi:methyl-accepting chemotaxis protein